MNVSIDAIQTYSNNYNNDKTKGILRLVEDSQGCPQLTFVNLNSLSLFEKVMKFFGFGGFDLKSIWLFVDRELSQEPELKKVIPFLHAYQMKHNEHCSYSPSLFEW